MAELYTHVQYTLRQWKKAPGFALTAILTLALGLGANTAIFSLLDQALLRSLPVRDPKKLVVLEGTGKAWEGRTSTRGGWDEDYFSYPMYRDLRDKNQVFEGLLATLQVQAGVEWNHRSELSNAALVSGNYFDVLGVGPALGRVLTQQDDVVKNGAPVVVLSFNYWKTHFGSNPSIVNQTISINGHPYQVVGVSKPGFESALWGSPADIFVPMTMKPQLTPGWDDLDNRRSRWLNIIGRLKQSETPQHAQASLAPLWHGLRAEELKQISGHSARFEKGFLTDSRLLLHDGARGYSYNRNDLRMPLLVEMGMVILVTLMAAVNVASLILVRAAGRVREFSMRYALGADRKRVLSQLAIEGIMLGLTGGFCALFLAPLVTKLLLHQMMSNDQSNPFSTSVDFRLALFNFAVAIGVSLLFTLAPALQFWKPDLIGAMKQQSAASTGTALGFRRLTVGLQIGLSMLLLIGSALFVQTLKNLRSVDVGFATDHLMTFAVDPTLAGYPDEQILPLHKRILASLSTLPGVKDAVATDDPEVSGDSSGTNISIEGYNTGQDENIQVENASVSWSYFSGMKIPLLVGRGFTEQDDLNHPRVAIVNDTLAKRYFGDPVKAVGGHIAMGSGNNLKYNIEIVGVVRSSVHRNVQAELKPTLFRPFLQVPGQTGMQYYVRTWSAPDSASASIRNAMNQLDSKLVVDSLRTMKDQIDENITAQRSVAFLATSFGVLAAFLAGIGIYGVLAYSTAQRTREIGIRMAIGSDRWGVVALILRDLLKLAGVSIVVTIPVALVLTRQLKSQLYNVSGNDPVIFTLVTLAVGLLAIVAGALPARRAASVEPSQALRTE